MDDVILSFKGVRGIEEGETDQGRKFKVCLCLSFWASFCTAECCKGL